MADNLKQAQDVQKNLKTVQAGIRKLADSIKSTKKDGCSAKGGECEDEFSDVLIAAGGVGVALGGGALGLALAPATLGATLGTLALTGGATVVELSALASALKKWQECLKRNNDPKQKDAANFIKQVEDLRGKTSKEAEQAKKLK